MPIRAMIAATLVALFWGANYSAAHISMMELPPFLTVLLRFVLVSALLAPFALRKKFPPMRDMFFLAMSFVVLQFAFIFLSMDMGLTITSVIIASQLGAPFACVLAAILFKDFLGPWRSAGLMIAFLGVMIVAGTPNAAEHPVPFLLAVVGAFFWAVANTHLKRIPPQPGIVLLFWPALLSLPVLTALTLLFEHGQVAAIEASGVRAWGGILYSAFFSSLLGYGMWNHLITKYPMSRVVPFSLFVPLFGIGLAALLFDEAVGPRTLFGAALTILGVGIITLRRPSLAEAEKQ